MQARTRFMLAVVVLFLLMTGPFLLTALIVWVETAGEAREMLVEAGFMVDYIEARHAETLERIARRIEGPIRLLAAAKLGQTRLIDNIAV